MKQMQFRRRKVHGNAKGAGIFRDSKLTVAECSGGKGMGAEFQILEPVSDLSFAGLTLKAREARALCRHQDSRASSEKS